VAAFTTSIKEVRTSPSLNNRIDMHLVLGVTVKRRIGVEELAGITVSKMGQEFVIHVPKEYDYRFSSPDK